MQTIKLTIPGMKSAHCQMTVSDIIAQTGASVASIESMMVDVQLTPDVSVENVINAIEASGYEVQEAKTNKVSPQSIQFKTNIKCSGCVAKVTPFLDEAVGKDNWAVDYSNVEKVLTVMGEKDSEKIVQAVANAGYNAEVI